MPQCAACDDTGVSSRGFQCVCKSRLYAPQTTETGWAGQRAAQATTKLRELERLKREVMRLETPAPTQQEANEARALWIIRQLDALRGSLGRVTSELGPAKRVR